MSMEITSNYNGYVNGIYDTNKKTVEPVSQEKVNKRETSNSNVSAGMHYLQDLQKKFSGTNFLVGSVSYGQMPGKSGCNNIVVHPAYLAKIANDPEAQKQFEDDVQFFNEHAKAFAAEKAASGWEVVSQGSFCDKDGNWSGWVVTRKTDKKSFLQEMQEKSDKILEDNKTKREEQKKLRENQDKKAEKQLKEHFGNRYKKLSVAESEQMNIIKAGNGIDVSV